MDEERLKARIYRAFYVEHKEPSEIDKLVGLVEGEARRAIVHSWHEPTDYVQILIGAEDGSDHQRNAG